MCSKSKDKSLIILGFIFLGGAFLSFLLTFINLNLVNWQKGYIPQDKSWQNLIDVSQIKYSTDKTSYILGQTIKLSLVNNSDVPIYLAPCEDFNYFETKKANAWESKQLVQCSPFQIDKEFEKVKGKVESALNTSELGLATHRGVATIYFNCQAPNKNACSANQVIYSNEFTIKEKEITEPQDTKPTEPSVSTECRADKDCATGGCSGEVCTTKEKAREIVTPCVIPPYYECLKKTSCGCVEGKCQWKPNAQYLDCLKMSEPELY